MFQRDKSVIKPESDKSKLLENTRQVLNSVQSLSRVRLLVTPWTAARQTPLSITNSRSLLKLIKSVMSSNHLIPFAILLPPSIFHSIRELSGEAVFCIRWPKVLKFQLQHQSFQRIFRTDFL